VPTTSLPTPSARVSKKGELQRVPLVIEGEIFCNATMIKRFEANKARLRRHQRIRRHLEGTSSRPRLNVFRSGHHIYAQIIDDTTGRTLAAASSLDESLHDFKYEPSSSTDESATSAPEPEVVEVVAAAPAKSGKGAKQTRAAQPVAEKKIKKSPVEQLAGIAANRKVALAREVGKIVAQRAKEKGVTRVVFDRAGYAFHGRVAALAEGARETGLDF
jgi:large subunit ribosomal protein L18